jgi:hypothetical protein
MGQHSLINMCHEDYAECSRIERYTATMFARLNARILACVILPFTHTWKTLALTHHFTIINTSYKLWLTLIKKKYRGRNRWKIKDGGQIDTLTHKYSQTGPEGQLYWVVTCIKRSPLDTKGVIRIRKSKKICSPPSTTFLV